MHAFCRRYQYERFGRRVKRSWNQAGGAGWRLTASGLYVYGAGGEILVEYRSESGQWYGAQTTGNNIMPGGRAVARRVTGTSEVLGPIDRVDRLYRNHLGEVILNASTPYAQPFGSGGSDQFAGHKDDPETGMKHFGARYYHATSARWISADSLTARVYDPQSLNKYAYVRNDPVNSVDPDGRFRLTPIVYIDIWDGVWPMEDVRPFKDPYGLGGGGGGDASLVQFNAKVNKARQTLLQKLREPLSEKCSKFFDDIAIKPTEFLKKLEEVIVLEGTTNQAVIDTLIGPDAARLAGVSGWTTAELFKKGVPNARYGPGPLLGWSPIGSPNIYMVYSAVTPENLAHEVFHKFDYRDDAMLMRMLDSSDSLEGTAIISKKFKEACLQ